MLSNKIRPSGIKREQWKQNIPQTQQVGILSGVIGTCLGMVDLIDAARVMAIDDPKNIPEIFNPLMEKLRKRALRIDEYSADLLELTAWTKESWANPNWQGKSLVNGCDKDYEPTE